MKNYDNWNVNIDESNILWLALNVLNKSTNVLSFSVLKNLTLILNDYSKDSNIKGIVFLSDKPNGFIAGADVTEFEEVEDTSDAIKLITFGQEVMNKIESMECPTVALIHGFCLGGGLELALACDYRIALKDNKIKLGFPEIKLGIHPGFGGTVRSIETIGPLPAMDLMLTGRTINAYQAKKLGLVDQLVAEQYLFKAAQHFIQEQPPLAQASSIKKLFDLPLVKEIIAKKMVKEVSHKVKKEHYPAPFDLINLWVSFSNNRKLNFSHECDSVASLCQTVTSRNLVRVFGLQNILKSSGDKSIFKPKHVHVIGGGVMGGDIAIWCALQGFIVTLQDSSTTAIGNVIKRATKLFTYKLRDKRLITEALDRLIPDEKGNGIPKADVIIEAIYENIEAKRTLFKDIESRAKKDALIATNTSSILLETLTEEFQNPERLVGIHFFNPVSKMPLVEIIHSSQTQSNIIEKAMAFTRHIDKLPLKVKSSPGFLVNRVLMPYLIEAAKLEAEGISKESIDKVATDFGMPMGPIELMDTVGLDIVYHVGEILSETYGFTFPDNIKMKVDVGDIGKKSGHGFYEYKDGKPVKSKPTEHVNENIIRHRLISALINECKKCIEEGIVDSEDLLDAGVIFGTGFAPFRGGPLNYNNYKG